MKILVTGAAGFVGRHLVSALLMQTSWRVVALDRNVDLSETDDLLYDGRLRVVRAELGGLMTAPWCEGVDVVVNLASSSDVPSFLDKPYEHTINNVASTLSLLEWARYQSLRTFIHVSTNEVFGPRAVSLSVEDDALWPQTPYSASKAAQEMLVMGWRQTYDVPAVIINTMHVFGEGQPPQRFVPTAIDKIIKGEPIPIYNYPAGAPVRNWTYVGNLVQALIWLIYRGAGTGERLDRWNVVGPEMSCLNLVRGISHLLEREFTVDWQMDGTRRPGYDYRYALDGTKIEEAGFEEPYGFVQGLLRTIDWVKSERGEG